MFEAADQDKDGKISFEGIYDHELLMFMLFFKSSLTLPKPTPCRYRLRLNICKTLRDELPKGK